MLYHHTPLQEISHGQFEKAGVRVFVKREDLNHPFISGNKWWKLKYNLTEAAASGYSRVLTFGGAYSNHIYATAAAARELGFRSIGIIRGEKTTSLNHTLQFATERGMMLKFISRELYAKKHSAAFVDQLEQEFGKFYLIPEGGTNSLAVKGCAEFASEHLQYVDFDLLYLPVGTGGTMAGIVAGMNDTKKIIGVAVLKQGDFLRDEVRQLISHHNGKFYGNWNLLTEYHHGGYAKTTPALLELIEYFAGQNLPLDQVYTAKMMYAIVEQVTSGQIPRGSKVLALHTGGLQGARSINAPAS